MTVEHLQEVLDGMPASQRAAVKAAVADWEAIKSKHGDAGSFAFALVALTLSNEEQK